MQATRVDHSSLRTQLLESIAELPYIPLAALGRIPRLAMGARAEARRISVTHHIIQARHWPAAFDDLRVAFLTDLHCSPVTPADFLERVMDETNRAKPDVILLGGDYVTVGTDYIAPVAAVLKRLRAPLGVFGVLGNHDYISNPDAVRAALRQAGVVDVTNGGAWLERGGSRVRIAGVGDLWQDHQDLPAALGGAEEDDAAILLTHNPDYAVGLRDRRVRLVLAGHTHGGQIRLPGIGALITNSAYGQRLVKGLVPFDTFPLYVSRGIGTVVVPFRRDCPPEIAVFTLRGSYSPLSAYCRMGSSTR